jgi:hypothetical protein
MDKSVEKTLAALLAQAGLEPKEGDLERFGDLIDKYVASLKTLHSVDLGDEEIAPTFNPDWNRK